MDIRSTDQSPIGDAESSYNDWSGTAVAEDSFVIESGDLYEIAGLGDERKRWAILGIELDAYSHGADPTWTIRVYAADVAELGVEGFEDWERVAGEHGGIPVADIELHDVTPNDIIKCMKLIGVQFRRASIPFDLLRSAYGDHPPQE